VKKRQRDGQRQKVYDAEKPFRNVGEPVADIEAASKLVVKLLNNARIKRLYDHKIGKKPIRVRLTRIDSGKSHASESHIALHPEWGLTRLVIAHELAHVIVRRTHGYYGAQGHGPEFCAVYLDLVQAALGIEVRNQLIESFKAHRVKFRLRKKREYTQEQRRAMAENLKKARAVAAARAYAREQPQPWN